MVRDWLNFPNEIWLNSEKRSPKKVEKRGLGSEMRFIKRIRPKQEKGKKSFENSLEKEKEGEAKEKSEDKIP